jgi:hypothetical protein
MVCELENDQCAYKLVEQNRGILLVSWRTPNPRLGIEV